MFRNSHLPLDGRSIGLIAIIVIMAVSILFSSSPRAALRSSGAPQLVSVEPFPEPDSEMCPWTPASMVLQSEGTRAGGPTAALESAAGASTKVTPNSDRAPVRVIRDTYPAFSAVALNTKTDEVFLQDENLFGINVYNRLDNTPPTAKFTEPKRVLGGEKTKLEYNCSLYIDPNNGDIYSLSNDVIDTMTIFPHDAKGNVEPKRELATPQATFALAVDEEHQEIFMSVQQTSSIVVYRKAASGKEPPLRQLIGEATQISDPHGIAVDPKKELMFVNNAGSTHAWDKNGNAIPASGKFTPPSITVYHLKDSGNTAPIRVITGPRTQLNWPANMYLDTEHGELYVANDGSNSISVFRETDEGDVAPIRILKGSKTDLTNPTGLFVDNKNNELWVANMGSHTATVYARTASGDAKPLRTIRSAPANQPSMMFAQPSAVGYDSKRDEILTVN